MSPSTQLAAAQTTSGHGLPPAGTQQVAGHPDGVRAAARIRAAHNGRVTTLPQLHSDGPFHLRRLRTHGNAATVGIISAMSAPLGGDRLTLDITVEERAELEITTAAATLALRGPTTSAATYDVRLTVGEHARLRWLPQPLISAAGSNLRQTYTVELAATSRLVLREEQLLGRADEEPGHLVTRILVHRTGCPLFDQHTAYGAPEPGWDGPAVLNGHRAVGQLLIVDPRLDVRRDPVLLGGEGTQDGCAVLAPLAGGPALLATAVAPTTSRLRHLLDQAHAHALAAVEASGPAVPVAPSGEPTRCGREKPGARRHDGAHAAQSEITRST